MRHSPSPAAETCVPMHSCAGSESCLPIFIFPFCLMLTQPRDLRRCHGRHVYAEIDLMRGVVSREPGVTKIERKTRHLRFPVQRRIQIGAHKRTDHKLVGYADSLLERKLEK